MTTKKVIRYEKLSNSEIEDVLSRLKPFGEISYNNTDTYTTFFLLGDMEISPTNLVQVLALSLDPYITSIHKEIYIDNLSYNELQALYTDVLG